MTNKQRIHNDSYKYFIVKWPEDYPSIQNRDQCIAQQQPCTGHHHKCEYKLEQNGAPHTTEKKL